MKIIRCTRPVDTYIGETYLNVRYLVIKQWAYVQDYGMIHHEYEHYGIFLNNGAYFDLFVDRFEEERIL